MGINVDILMNSMLMGLDPKRVIKGGVDVKTMLKAGVDPKLLLVGGLRSIDSKFKKTNNRF